MSLFPFRIVTYGLLGWWWARRHGYPADAHGVTVPLYGWVDEAHIPAAMPVADHASGKAAPGLLPVSSDNDDRADDHGNDRDDDRIAAFPARA